MTNSYMITCCSTADLPASYLTERGIPYSCFHFRMNGMEYDDDLGKSIPIEDFYENIRQGAMPTTRLRRLRTSGGHGLGEDAGRCGLRRTCILD